MFTHLNIQKIAEKFLSNPNDSNFNSGLKNMTNDIIRNNSDNPKWFDGSRAMKVVTNVISHKVDAKYIVPTRINMEDGIKASFG